MTAEGEQQWQPSVNRRFSLEESEFDPLLKSGLEPGLYRSISHVSTTTSQPAEVSAANDHGNAVQKATGVYTTISVLLLGVFISQTDQSFVLATYGTVSSEFDDLGSGSWLMSAYILAQCVAQPLYGKLSDIYGRKACLQGAYFLFTVGTTASGLGQSMGQVIAGRAIQGAGGAGMVALVSVIIADLVPLSEVATLWSYVNILQTTGRSCGGFIGGLLTQTLGWRLAFLIQVPPMVIAIFLVQWRLHLPGKHVDKEDNSTWQKLKRVDFVGAFFLCYAIFAGCFVLDAGGEKYSWDSPLVITILASGMISLLLFIISARLVNEPIFPLRLLTHYGLVTNYAIVMLQVMCQLSLMMSVPLYFQATKHATTAAAGAYLIPAFVGNTLGGLLGGIWIRKTGLYKWPTVLSPVLSVTCMLLCLFLWQGDTNVWEATYILPGGFGQGMVTSAAFVGMAASISPDDVAIAGNGMYLFLNIGAIAGASAGAASYQSGLRSGLDEALQGMKGRSKIRKRLLEDITYLWKLSTSLRERLMPAYVRGFHNVITMGLTCACISLFIAIFTRSTKLERAPPKGQSRDEV